MKQTRELTREEQRAFDDAVTEINANAEEHCQLRPAMSTLLEEVAEAILAARGIHDDSLQLEITQIGGICINILWQLAMNHDDHVCNIGTSSRYWEDK